MRGGFRSERDDEVRVASEGPDDFLEYLGSIGGQLAHLARRRRFPFLALLLDMMVKEVVSLLEGRSTRSRPGAG